jgi:antitoxin component of MazEF toxin-antitoxin module
VLKITRKIVSNGNSSHVSLSPQILDFLRWRAGDTVVIEAIDVDKIIVRPARLEDLRSPRLPLPVNPPAEKNVA